MKYVLVFNHHYAIPGRIKRPLFHSKFSLGSTDRTTIPTRFPYKLIPDQYKEFPQNFNEIFYCDYGFMLQRQDRKL